MGEGSVIELGGSLFPVAVRPILSARVGAPSPPQRRPGPRRDDGERHVRVRLP